MKKHEHIHLKLDPKQLRTTRRKNYNVYLLWVGSSGWKNLGIAIPDALCGAYVKKLVNYTQRERVTCGSCRRLMLVHFPVAENPRSHMAMPRPGSDS